MSLYNDLPQAKNAADNTLSWAPGTRLAPPNVIKKPTQSFGPPPSVLRSGRGGGRGRLPGRGIPGRPDLESLSNSANNGSSTIINVFGDIKDEYDPARPNDYEDVIKERERKKNEAAEEAERQARLKDMESMKEEAEKVASKLASNLSAAMLPPPTPIPTSAHASAPTVVAKGALPGLGEYGGDEEEEEDQDAAGPKGKLGMGLAQKLLEKMGWREGDGLGRNRQGMSTPLIAQKIDRRAGIIVNAPDLPGPGGSKRGPDTPASESDKRTKAGIVIGIPSKVVCLRNMVGPGEVDPDLEDEVGNELMKYGNVVSVLIFEVTTPGFIPEEAVRIFVEFDRIESTTKAIVDLQGRFFGGRMVRAAFFSEERFAKQQLAPQAGEFD